MDKLILLSILAAHMLIPVMNANDPDPKRGLRKTMVTLFLFNLGYAGALYFIYPRLAALG